MTPARWQQIKIVFDQAIARAPLEREDLLRQACAGDDDLYREVVSLIGSYDTSGSFFEKPILTERPAIDPMVGRRFGVYQTVREIGRGGMGSVYLATRADDQFRRRVALKALKPEVADDHTLRRFQNERQTLAVLDHPNIIKLLDGGQSDDGLPYLVMDYVEGQPIQEYCDSHKLTVPERLKLFRTVCGAVHYAHQNLVVHRDLKPANILITPEGVPKLLDFGIAKLLRPEYVAAIGITRTRLQPMTPKYASPEQVLGQPITTASDIYSMGVLLYELLTGRHPYERQGRTELELEKAIAELDPEKPSVAVTHAGESTAAMLGRFREARPEHLSRLLSGDLDCIVLMAMRKEPQRRYASAEHLSEDVRRHMERQPVMARKGTVQYRLGKFVRRHKLGVAAALLIAVTLVSSTLVTYRAMRHTRAMFEDLRQFDNFVVKDLDAMLRRGGATPARQAMLAKAVESLDRLAHEANGDPALQTDLITAYVKMGDVQGNFFVPNLGAKNAAEESYRKALTMAETLSRAHPADAAGKQQVGDIWLKLGDAMPNRREAIERYRKARDIYESMPAERAVQSAMMRAWDKTGATQGQLGDAAGALESYRRALHYANDLKRREAIEMLKERVAYFSALNGDAAGAEEAVLAAIRAYRDSTNVENPRNVAAAFRVLAEVQKRAGKIDAALASVETSLKITADLLAENPQDKLHQIDHEQGLLARIELLSAAGRKQEEREETARALRLLKPWIGQADVTDYQIQDYVRLLLCTPFPEFRDHAAALRYAQKLAGMTREADPKVLDLLARAYDKNGDRTGAIETERKAIALLPSVTAGARPSELRTGLETNLQTFQSEIARKN